MKPLPKSLRQGFGLEMGTRRINGAAAYLSVLVPRVPTMLVPDVLWAIRLFWNEVPFAGLVTVTPTELYINDELLSSKLVVAAGPETWAPLPVF